MQESEHPVVREFELLALDLLTKSTEELFASYGCEVQIDSASGEVGRRSVSAGAAIGFTGEYVRGVLAIGLDDPLARSINPIDNGSGSGDDWLGELANQLLGRLKNKLLSYNVELALSTPVVVRGSELRFGTTHRQATHLRFHVGDCYADVWWDAEVDPVLELSEAEAPDVQLEGEMVLF